MKQKVALITGITGQDGSYLSRLLLDKGYEVHGIIRRSSSFNTGRIDDIFDKLNLHYGDMTDPLNLSSIINRVEPEEIYNLAAQSHVKVSFETPYYTSISDALGPLAVLEIAANMINVPKVYQASTSEMFGTSPAPQNENTPFQPCSPYGAAKLSAYWMTRNYRTAYGMFACNGILFNHESPYRGETFVTRKVTKAVAEYYKTGALDLTLGNLDAKRDWGHAKDYVEAMWLMLQQDKPDDYVIATGKSYTIKQLVETAFAVIEEPVPWDRIKISNKYYRPNEVPDLCGDATKAKEKLGWQPKIKFETMIREMVVHDIAH